jgi:hypothetical protein
MSNAVCLTKGNGHAAGDLEDLFGKDEGGRLADDSAWGNFRARRIFPQSRREQGRPAP